jgi:addiction module HigA family antidote
VPRVRTHPGEVLNAEFMVPLGLSARRLAKQIGVPPNRITEIIRGRRDLSADTALRLSRCFGTTAQFWLNLQDAHELSKAEATHDYTGIKALHSAKTATKKAERGSPDRTPVKASMPEGKHTPG